MSLAAHQNPALHAPACNAANAKLVVAERFAGRARANYKRALRENVGGRRPGYVRSTARTMRIEEANEARLRAERDAIHDAACGMGRR